MSYAGIILLSIFLFWLNDKYNIYWYNKNKAKYNDFRLGREIEAAFLSAFQKMTIEEARQIVSKWQPLHKYYRKVNWAILILTVCLVAFKFFNLV